MQTKELINWPPFWNKVYKGFMTLEHYFSRLVQPRSQGFSLARTRSRGREEERAWERGCISSSQVANHGAGFG